MSISYIFVRRNFLADGGLSADTCLVGQDERPTESLRIDV